MPDDIASLLAAVGITAEEIAAASAGDPLEIELLVAERVALPERRYLTLPEVWRRAGVDEETARRLWRAMGFADPPDDEPALGDSDVEALAVAADLLRRASIEPGVALQQTRAMGQAMARVAGAQQDVIEERTGDADRSRAIAAAVELAETALPAIDRLIVYLYRRHLAAATRRNVLLRNRAGDAGVELCIGFADLVGFTALSQQLAEEELAALVDNFATVASDTVAAHGGRVVKMIGDEVMFSTEHAGTAARLALDLVGAYPPGEGGPTIRVGLAAGEVLAREGDLFGPTVNLASRLTAIARPASVLVNDAVAGALDGRRDLTVRPIRPHSLKGLGRVRSYVVRGAGEPD